MTADWVDVFLVGGISQVVLLEWMSLASKSSVSMFTSRHGSFGSLNAVELSSPSNDFNEGDERNELLLLLDNAAEASKLRSKFNSSTERRGKDLFLLFTSICLRGL